MFSKIRGAFLKTPAWLRAITWISIALIFYGDASNQLVQAANDGAMPVAMQKEDILFVIGRVPASMKYGVTANELGAGQQPLTKDTKFRILADRIPISFCFIPPSKLPHWFSSTLNHWDIPVAREGIASVGDLLLWTGKWLALPTFPVLLIYLMWKLFSRFWRKI